MRSFGLWALSALLSLQASAYDRPANNDRTRPLDPAEMREYHADPVGDHFEWTLYGQPYHLENYGHRYLWKRDGLSSVSQCIEVDIATNGKKFREFVEDAYCPPVQTEYVWDTPIEGHPSRCLKRDIETAGGRFMRIVDRERCTKPSVFYRWETEAITGKERCFELDGTTAGQKYRQLVDPRYCPTRLNVDTAFGRKIPSHEEVPLVPRAVANGRSPASVSTPEKDKRFWEDPEDLVEHVHVHNEGDKIHHR